MKMKFSVPNNTARQFNRTLTLREFFPLHEDFLKDKILEGLASRTLKDHRIHMGYFKSYMAVCTENQSTIDRNLFKSYVYFMLHEKQLKPCTINVRLRTLKCYLTWFHSNGHLQENFAVASPW